MQATNPSTVSLASGDIQLGELLPSGDGAAGDLRPSYMG
jgi:hypothetical protein